MMIEDNFSRHTYSYLALRKAVGWIGILLPFVLMIGAVWIFQGNIFEQSISHYYHTGMRNVFVGTLCALALFLFFYCGYDNLDNWVGNVAGFFAVGVAWFPTTETGPSDLIGKIHFFSAAVLFLSLAFFSLFLFTKTKDIATQTPEKKVRNRIYIVCGVIMLGCLISIVVYKNLIQGSDVVTSFVFWAETVALVAFGVSWLTKGGTLYPDSEESTDGQT